MSRGRWRMSTRPVAQHRDHVLEGGFKSSPSKREDAKSEMQREIHDRLQFG